MFEMRFSIFGRKRPAEVVGTEVTGSIDPLMVLRIAGPVPQVSRSLGRRTSAFGFERLFVPSAILDYTVLLMRMAGAAGDEKFLAWAGMPVNADAVVTTVVNPRAAAGRMHGEILAPVVATMFDALDARDLVIFAQLHTHPAGNKMSDIDRVRPLFAVKGFWSIIVPDFAFVPPDAVDAWGVYEFESAKTWREFGADEKRNRLIVDDSIINAD